MMNTARSPSGFLDDRLVDLARYDELIVEQQHEPTELFGFETRNQYTIEAAGRAIAFAAEQGGGAMDAILRQFLGHMRRFEVHVAALGGVGLLRIEHPFRWWLQRLDVYAAESGRRIGAIQQRFSLLRRRFDVLDASDTVLLTMAGPILRPWTFPFTRAGSEVAVVEKKWSGMLREAFTDADRFRIAFRDRELGPVSRLLVIAAAFFIDLQYFERKASK